MSVVDRLRTPRSERFVRFLGVGVIGMVVDLAITFALLPHTHYLVANSAGFLVAVSHNFVGNWWVTYRRPDGNVAWQYLSYVGLHGATFACRAIALTAVVEAAGVPPSVGTAIGVVVAAVLNFAGSETIFGGDQRIWFDIVEATNHLAHAIYSSRLRSVLVYTGLYNPVFRVYTLGLASTYRASSRAVSVRGTSAMLATEKPTETVSVLHTLEKEGDVLADFVADVQPDDRVLDVGANVGVYSALAADCGADVSAVEPHGPTADRLRLNCPDATVHELALGNSVGEVGLAIQNDRPGTQRPAVGGETMTVPQVPADRLASPDVVKIDVEGAEVGVLDGMERTLAESPPRVVWIECHDGTASAVRERLTGHGYDVETVYSDGEQYLRAESGLMTRESGEVLGATEEVTHD
jgi:FkbM family methyltransferase